MNFNWLQYQNQYFIEPYMKMWTHKPFFHCHLRWDYCQQRSGQLIELTISTFLPWFTQTYLPDHEIKKKNHLLNLYCLQKIQSSETKQFLFSVCNWKVIFWRHRNISLYNCICSKSVYHSFKQRERCKLTQVMSLIKSESNYINV